MSPDRSISIGQYGYNYEDVCSIFDIRGVGIFPGGNINHPEDYVIKGHAEHVVFSATVRDCSYLNLKV